jgi:hypothetical protein
MPTTFVTAFMELNEPFQRENYKEQVLANFKRILDSGISVHVFLSPGLVDSFKEVIPARDTLFISQLSFTDLDIYTIVNSIQLGLPSVRSPNKDTRNYMILMNAKAEFLYRSICIDPFGMDHYAWMDFGLGHVFHNWPNSMVQLQRIANAELVEKCLVFPGCWKTGRDVENLFMRINWRFCGGFFIGDTNSLLNFYEVYMKNFETILKQNKCITWEVNIWHWFEYHLGWKPTWYAADHNDSIIHIPENCFKKQGQELTQEQLQDQTCLGS